jgi:hypothetical protein
MIGPDWLMYKEGFFVNLVGMDIPGFTLIHLNEVIPPIPGSPGASMSWTTTAWSTLMCNCGEKAAGPEDGIP